MTIPPTLVEAVRNVSEGRCERQGVQALWCVYAEGDAVYLEIAEGGRKRVATKAAFVYSTHPHV